VKRLGPALIVGALAFSVAGTAAAYALANRVITNHTPSMPLAKYLALPPIGLHVGSFATACVPPDKARAFVALGATLEHGDCPGGFATILKVVVALPGQEFAVSDRGIVIDGRLLASSKPYHSVNGHRLPRPLPQRVPAGSAILWSPVSTALDSRYLGPLAVRDVAFPMATFDAATRSRLTPAVTN
jgi:conjugative transfer signal peptidase TraF